MQQFTPACSVSLWPWGARSGSLTSKSSVLATGLSPQGPSTRTPMSTPRTVILLSGVIVVLYAAAPCAQPPQSPVPVRTMMKRPPLQVPVVPLPPPRTQSLTFIFDTGDDDLRNNSALKVRVLDRQGRPLTGFSGTDRYRNQRTVVWATVKDSERPGIRSRTWEPRSRHEVTVRLNEPVALDSIGSFALRLVQGRDLADGLQMECIGCTDDNWDMRSVWVRATFRRPGEPGVVKTWAFDSGDQRPSRFTKDFPVLVLTPLWDQDGAATGGLRGRWQRAPSGRVYDE